VFENCHAEKTDGASHLPTSLKDFRNLLQ